MDYLVHIDFVCSNIVRISNGKNECWARYKESWSHDEIRIWIDENQCEDLDEFNPDFDIEYWIEKNNLQWPFSKETQILFELTWG